MLNGRYVNQAQFRSTALPSTVDCGPRTVDCRPSQVPIIIGNYRDVNRHVERSLRSRDICTVNCEPSTVNQTTNTLHPTVLPLEIVCYHSAAKPRMTNDLQGFQNLEGLSKR